MDWISEILLYGLYLLIGNSGNCKLKCSVEMSAIKETDSSFRQLQDRQDNMIPCSGKCESVQQSKVPKKTSNKVLHPLKQLESLSF
uniref:Uncharacterized protein n=1 Tax=Romanomermis culicivorax TaxID=13658 RepID=A0A915IEK4_ROMCU